MKEKIYHKDLKYWKQLNIDTKISWNGKLLI